MARDFQQPVFRFAPSPNGELHLGHAYSALLNFDLAQQCGGTLLLRVEDIDTTRCTAELEVKMLEDLRWLGIVWQGEPRRQSEHFAEYKEALDRLEHKGLIYPSFMSRGERNRFITDNSDADNPWPKDPDGAPLYPDIDRKRNSEDHQKRIDAGEPFALRLDMHAALDSISSNENEPLYFEETGTSSETGKVLCDPSLWGDVILGRRETPTSYHLSVVMDDALQNITHVVRGRDLFDATSVHRLLQELLGLSPPVYHHHELILDNEGHKLSKSASDTSLRSLQLAGATPNDIRRMVGLTHD